MARILIASPHSELRTEMAQALKRDGHEALFATVGRESLTLLEQEQPAVAIFTTELDEPPALMLLDLLKQAPWARNIKLLLAGPGLWDGGEAAQRMREAQADAILALPCKCSSFLTVVRSLLPAVQQASPESQTPITEMVAQVWDGLERKSYYELLGVPPDAIPERIRAYFLRRSLLFHPDRYQAQRGTELFEQISTIYKRLNEAYSVLAHPGKRQEYDEQLSQGNVRLTETGGKLRSKDGESSIKDLSARKFFRMGREALETGNVRAARMHLQLALSREPGNKVIAELYASVDGKTSPSTPRLPVQRPVDPPSGPAEVERKSRTTERVSTEPERSMTGKALADLTVQETLAVELPRAAVDRLAAEKLAAEKLAAEKLAAERLAAERLAAEKLAAEKLAAEKLAAEKLAAEKLAAEKLAAEKLAAPMVPPLTTPSLGAVGGPPGRIAVPVSASAPALPAAGKPSPTARGGPPAALDARGKGPPATMGNREGSTTTESSRSRHVAVVAGGSLSWAKVRGVSVFEALRRSVEQLRTLIELCLARNIAHLTLHAPAEPQEEGLGTLLDALLDHLLAERAALRTQGISLELLGNTEKLPPGRIEKLTELMTELQPGDRLMLHLILTRDGRRPIVQAVRALAEALRVGRLAPDQIEESTITSAMPRMKGPPPSVVLFVAGPWVPGDLMIWQTAPSIRYLSEATWPDFDRAKMEAVLDQLPRYLKD